MKENNIIILGYGGISYYIDLYNKLYLTTSLKNFDELKEFIKLIQ